MNKILETSRTYLRELTIDDALHFHELNADKEVIKYTGDVAFESIEKAKEFLLNYNHYKKFGYGRWAVIDKSNHEFLGWCGLKYTAEVDEVDIGFRFFKMHWNKGFASESAKACIDYGFEKLNLNSIVGRAMEANIASIKVLEKIGMNYINTIDFEKHRGVLYLIQKS
ncbi:GNAT family N-acetyltransferase [Flavobacterium sp.]|uniref:GNAT family N-acetyltransferase n=1 Tax=Flavobacterium sp. TaxID=239 RepID=UPI00261834D8|nr:GNAT family N-acetyltransferase [Flavobacterium sp.]